MKKLCKFSQITVIDDSLSKAFIPVAMPQVNNVKIRSRRYQNILCPTKTNMPSPTQMNTYQNRDPFELCQTSIWFGKGGKSRDPGQTTGRRNHYLPVYPIASATTTNNWPLVRMYAVSRGSNK